MASAHKATHEPAVAGLRIMVVEDAVLVAMELEDQLIDWSCEVVGPFSRVQAALSQIDNLDGALPGVNLGKEQSFPIAVALAAQSLPFIFLTGYDRDTAFPAQFQAKPKLTKPFEPAALLAVIRQHFVTQSAHVIP